jgi:rubrerythrin
MARQERDHIEFVQALAEKLGELPAPEAATEPHQGYVEALMEAHILVQEGAGAALAKRAADLAGATKGAMQFEKDTILLFQTLANLVPEAGMTAVETLIGQEKMHLLDLYQFSTLLKMAERNQPTQDAGGSHKPQKGKMR